MISLIKPPIELVLEGEHEAFMVGAIGKCPEDFKYELGGVGRVEIDNDGMVVLGQPVILPQQVTEGECEFRNQITEWIKTWSPQSCEQEMPNVSYYQWHSHNSMGVFWSPQDEEWIRNYSNLGLLVSLVGNHKGEWKARVDTVSKKGDMHLHHKIDCKLYVVHPERPAYIAAAERAKKLRDELVEIPKTVQVVHGQMVHCDTSTLLERARESISYGGYNLSGDSFDCIDGVLARHDADKDLPQDLPLDDIALPHGITVAKLVAKHQQRLKVYFVLKHEGDDEPHQISFMCNAMTMYTVDATNSLCKQMRKVFRISSEAMKHMLGSGKRIHYVPRDKGGRWQEG